MKLVDPYQRAITYLRISVIERCNYRCIYCLPPEGVEWIPHDQLLTYEEITQFVRILAGSGIRRVRLTGGEPLVRKDLPDLVRMISSIPGIEEVSLTTNGALLGRFAEQLKEAGLKRINVSLDTLDPDRFRKITRGGSLGEVMDGIAAAEKAGLAPIKLNCVMVKGVNDDELVEMARLTYSHDWEVRFIELMPVGNCEDWGEGFPPDGERCFPASEIRSRLEQWGLKPVNRIDGNGPARIYQLDGAQGRIGFISPVGEHFCGSCNRLRLTADGRIRPCLLNDLEIPIRDALRAGIDLLPLIQRSLELKPKGHTLADRQSPTTRKMAQIGG